MSEKINISDIDKNMKIGDNNADDLDFYTVDDEPFELDGLYWHNKGERLRRLPKNVKISTGVNVLAWHTAGVMLRFKSDTDVVRIKVKLRHSSHGGHMPATGSCGFDIYVGSHRAKFYAGTTKIAFDTVGYDVNVFGPAKVKKMREFTIHFPLYSGISTLEIGLTKNSQLLPPSPWQDPRPIVVYGTSIQQGGCASRPGMCHTNIMSRMLDRPFINLSFSGSAMGEKEMAQTMAEIKDPAMFILDYDANAMIDGLRATLSDFIDILREKHPEVPILLISALPRKEQYGDENEFPTLLEHEKEFETDKGYPSNRFDFTQIHLDELKRRREAGEKNIHFIDGTTLLGDEPLEALVDGLHATDLGFYLIAKRTAPVIERILSL